MYMYMCVGHQRVWRQCMYYVLVFVCTFACVCNYNYVCSYICMCAFAGERLTMKKLQDSMEQSSDDTDRDSDDSDIISSGS